MRDTSFDKIPIAMSIAFVCHQTGTHREFFNELSIRDRLDLINDACAELLDENNKTAQKFRREFVYS
jgi:hypothetical protein